MEQLILKQQIVDSIRKDPILYGQVAFLLGVTPLSFQRILAANDPRLTQSSILKTIREHLKIKNDSDLLTKLQAA